MAALMIPLLGALGIIVALAQPAHADCDCPTRTLDEQIERADVVFEGVVRSISEDVQGTRTGSWNYAMHVSTLYKGTTDERVNLRSARPGRECSLDLQSDVRYLVYAMRYNEFEEYESTPCLGTKRLDDAETDLEKLGPGAPPPPFSCASIPPGATAAILGLAWGTRRRFRPSR